MTDITIRTWHHSRKGRITGRVVRQNDTWVDIRLVGDHQLQMRSSDDDGYRPDGDVITVRRSLLTDVTR